MKKSLFVLLSSAMLAVACAADDDSGNLSGRMDELESRVKRLELKCEQMNQDISTLKAIVEALGRNEYISDVVEIENGYRIIFASGRVREVRTGVEVNAPSIAIEMGDDGLYYWTVDGARMTDPATGKEVTANAAGSVAGEAGADGVTPRLRIMDGWWQVSYDEGDSWSNLVVISDGTGADSIFSSVIPGEDSVTFILAADGSEISVPRAGAISITLDLQKDIAVLPGGTVRINYKTKGANMVTTLSDGGYSASVTPGEDGEGIIAVTAPDPISDWGKVIVVASREDGRAALKILSFKQGHLNVTQDAMNLTSNGGTVIFSIDSDLTGIKAESDVSWAVPVYEADNSRVVVTVAQSSELLARSATISILGNGSAAPLLFYVLQDGLHEPTLGSLESLLFYKEEI